MAYRVIPAGVAKLVGRSWLDPFLLWLDTFLHGLAGGGWNPVRVITQAPLAANTWTLATQTKEANANGALTIDGVAMAAGDRFWDKDDATGLRRGLFEVVSAGGVGSKWKVKRPADADASADYFDGKSFTVAEGTNAGQEWKLTNNAPFVLNTDTPAIARETGVVHTDDTQTITGAKSFATTMLRVLNAGATFAHRFVSSATATRTVTLPDADFTPAQAAQATGGTAPAFTGTAPTTAAVELLAGVGLTAAGQDVTTTDNQTLAENALAGCWLLPATKPPALILSHPACNAAPAVFTVMGEANTDAGAYKVLRAPTPVGAVASHTHAQT